MGGLGGDRLVAIVSLLLVLFLVGRGLPARRWPLVAAVTLVVILGVLALDQGGYWPQAWRLRG